MSNKFKAGDRVKCIRVLNTDLVFNKEYDVYAIAADGSVSLCGVDGFYRADLFVLAKSDATPDGLLPFNYEEAIKDLSRVVTRDGQNAYLNDLKRTTFPENLLIAETNRGYLIVYNSDGTQHSGHKGYDLFLKQPETVVYQNVYNDGIAGNYKTLEEAILTNGKPLYVSKITITPTELKTETVHKY